MNKDRRVLAWVGIAFSALCCLPLACSTGFISLAGGVSYVDEMSTWTTSDSLIFAGIVAVMIASVAIGLFLLIWGIRSLLHPETEDNKPESVQ